MTRDCVEQTSKKYTNRNSPPYPANVCPVGDKKKGNDANKNGVSRWVPVKVDSVKVVKKPAVKKSSRLKPCKPGQVRNPKTNR